MSIKSAWLLFIALSFSTGAGATPLDTKVIYGDDNRIEVAQCEDPLKLAVSESTLAIIPLDMVQFDKAGGYARIIGRKYGEEYNLCADEIYSHQPIAANCSASLVGEDLIATAGHCVTQYDCNTYQFVFGFRYSKEGVLPDEIPNKDIYSCKEVVAHKLDGSHDYALIRLDRPVSDRKPLPLQTEEARSGDDIYVIGHPGGLPAKIADGAKVRNQYGDFFNSNLDTYGGNSGSAVFSARTHQVVGILVRGETDFLYDEEKKCFSSQRCEDSGCRGEDATSIRFIKQALEAERSDRKSRDLFQVP